MPLIPAIAGIAELYSMITGTRTATMTLKGRYLAGLWKENIILDLCWITDTREKSRGRCHPYRAPSWSWASLDSALYLINEGTFSHLPGRSRGP